MPHRQRPTPAAATAALLVVACSHPTMAQHAPTGFETCDGVREAASCGFLSVPEDHDDPDGRSIELNVTILHGTSPTAGRPIYFLAGGPGQSVHDTAPLIAQRFGTRLAERDLVLIDQRGTGDSNPLSCATGAADDPARLFGPHYTEDELAACLADVGTRADPRLYTTPQFADDLVAVADRLGHDRFDVVGGSYGTKAALVLMRRHPARIGVAVLEGVAPPSFLNPLPHARGNRDVLDAEFARCAATPACDRRYPGLAERFPSLLERLAREPARVRTGAQAPIPLGRDELVYLTHILLFSAQSAALVPRLIDEVDRGEHGLLVALYRQILGSLVGGIDFGLQLSVTCTENLPGFDQVDVDALTRDTYLGRAMVDGVVQECEHWPAGTMPAGFYEPVTADVPTLLVAGALDPATPLTFAEEVDRALPESRLVVIESGAHITAHPCVDDFVAAFLRHGRLSELDTSCVAEIERPSFQIGQGGS